MSEYMYDIGDWIVHVEHGVGQIKARERKLVGAEERDFYKVETLSGVYRIAIDELGTDHIRPLASNEEINQALDLMQEPPHKLPDALKAREEEIARVRQDISIRAKAQIIRDLHGKRILDQISITEEFFLIKFKKEFIDELSAIRQETTDQAEDIMVKALASGISRNTMIEEG